GGEFGTMVDGRTPRLAERARGCPVAIVAGRVARFGDAVVPALDERAVDSAGTPWAGRLDVDHENGASGDAEAHRCRGRFRCIARAGVIAGYSRAVVVVEDGQDAHVPVRRGRHLRVTDARAVRRVGEVAAPEVWPAQDRVPLRVTSARCDRTSRDTLAW